VAEENTLFPELKEVCHWLSKDSVNLVQLLGLVHEFAKLQGAQCVEKLDATAKVTKIPLDASQMYILATEHEIQSRSQFPMTHFAFIMDDHKQAAELWDTYEDGLNDGITEAIREALEKLTS
jgi:hypothetical protein